MSLFRRKPKQSPLADTKIARDLASHLTGWTITNGEHFNPKYLIWDLCDALDAARNPATPSPQETEPRG